ncbi:CsbD family protein [Nucisporomicrobium flavum]|uniref:CsbD family protein n=1 Tax=Nucisporomicrobium flavum TaxID=2785915 RepID=UPI0018F77E7A|nr:hypothetical protein [Nucisporomicrobium flavum]
MGAKTKRWTGRVKQAAGTLTGNKRLEREGRADRRSAEAVERLAQARTQAGKMIDKAAGVVKGARTRTGGARHR